MADNHTMLATVFVATFVALPLSLTVGQMFRRPTQAPVQEDPLPRWSMRDFRKVDA